MTDDNAGMPADGALQRAARIDGPRVLSILASRFGDLDLADDAVQDALIDAARAWPETGVPDHPGAWLMTVARRRALDALRRQTRAANRVQRAAPDLIEAGEPSDYGAEQLIALSTEPDAGLADADDRLRLILLCCHPALERDAQVALTLRLVAGLTTREIASSFLVPEATLAQRIVRAKRKIRTAGIPLSLPSALDERIDAVLGIIYLIFNEGYLAHNEVDSLRPALVVEAIRLTRLVTSLAPGSAESQGLLALELFHQARAASRIDSLGDLVLLEEQDRTRWDRSLIDEANTAIAAAMSQMSPGAYQLQALIAAHHANAPSPEQTDWAMILALYDQLLAITASPVVELNRAVALAMVSGPGAGLAALASIAGLGSYHLFWACRGELEHRCGNQAASIDSFRSALAYAPGAAEKRHLERRIELLSG